MNCQGACTQHDCTRAQAHQAEVQEEGPLKFFQKGVDKGIFFWYKRDIMKQTTTYTKGSVSTETFISWTERSGEPAHNLADKSMGMF